MAILGSLMLMLSTTGFAERPPVNYDEAKVPEYRLPELLAFETGAVIATREAWGETRRGELLRLLESRMYGITPPLPKNPRFTVTSTEVDVFDGLATRRVIRLESGPAGQGTGIELVLYTPNQVEGPVPVFVGILLFPAEEEVLKPCVMLDGEGDGDPAEIGRAILERGYAVASMRPDDIAPDDAATFRAGLVGRVDPVDPTRPPLDSWGAIAAWAWALRFALDYFETDPRIDAKRVITIGHSRRGKTALWAAASDPRFAMAISNNSGCCGAALSRRRFGETVALINDRFPHWFCGHFKDYNENESAIPFDQHTLVALIAPRPVYIASAAEDLWADPRGEFLAALHGEPAYRLFGLVGVGTDNFPAIDEPIGSSIGYHVRRGKHALTDWDWMRYLDFADRHLGSTPTPP